MANDPTVISATSKNRPPPKPSGGKKDTAPPPSPRSFNGFSEITSFLWSVADLLRGDYKQADYGKVILPLTVLRRLDCALGGSPAVTASIEVERHNDEQPDGGERRDPKSPEHRLLPR